MFIVIIGQRNGKMTALLRAPDKGHYTETELSALRFLFIGA